ncbi:MAG: hypothetical protein KJT03_11140 [Verrucomicrobiae bacterium]|nr:hypothetical protein [Verrucomicrobiae bacterium]
MKKFLLTLSALGFSASFSFGQIVYEDFEDYPTFPTVNGGSGWTSGWTVAGGPPTIVSFGGSQALQIGYNNNAVLSRSFSSSYTGNFAFSYEMTFNTGSLGPNDFAALWIQDSNF